MKQEPELVSLRELLKAACEESVRREVDAYPTPKELKEKYPDTSEATRRTFAARIFSCKNFPMLYNNTLRMYQNTNSPY